MWPYRGSKFVGCLKATLTGPDLLSGGPFGPEASVLAVLVCTSMAIVLTVHAVRAGRIMRPFWTRRQAEPVGEIVAAAVPIEAPTDEGTANTDSSRI